MTNRQIFIDTETTGLSVRAGHRVVELAAIEAINGQLTGRKFHTYLNPGRPIDPYAQKVHGLSSEFLADKPRFSDIAKEFASFVQGSECLMHNAPFDTGFINAELAAAGYSERLQQMATIVCTVSLAKSRFPGESASLDSLIERSGNLNNRKNHSALEDVHLLAKIYFKLLAKPLEKSAPAMPQSRTTTVLPDLIPFVAKYAEHYLTLHRVHATHTYNYVAKDFYNNPVIEVSRHAKKCSAGETWMYVAVAGGSKLDNLSREEKLYVGAQTSDRMFRGDKPKVENFHHAQMRKGKGPNNLISFLRSGKEVEVYRFSGSRMRETINSIYEFQLLSMLIRQPLPPRAHLSWWFEQYVLHRELEHWQWNTKGAEKIIQKFLSAEVMQRGQVFQ